MPRRCHTKSRRGCVHCKERRVKVGLPIRPVNSIGLDLHEQCDEQRPSCNFCIKRELDCSYVTPPARRKPRVSSPGDSVEKDHSDAVPSDEPSGLSRLQEMHLFHHGCMFTTPSLARDEIDMQFWQVVIPQLATSHHYVMDSLLAVAALHLASLEAEGLHSWLRVALTYQNQAINGLRQTLVSRPQNHEALFTCSIFICLFVTAYPGICQDVHPMDPLDEILTVRSVLSGTVFFFTQVHNAQEKTSIDRWIHRDPTKEPVVPMKRHEIHAFVR